METQIKEVVTKEALAQLDELNDKLKTAIKLQHELNKLMIDSKRPADEK